MTVTISINHGIQWAEENNKVEIREGECGFLGAICHDGCPYCKGTSMYSEKVYPFELNVANGNWSTFANALGLVDSDSMYEGWADGRVIIGLIKRFCPELSIRGERGERDEQNEGEARIIDCGLSAAQVSRYAIVLAEIASEAERREEKVCWS